MDTKYTCKPGSSSKETFSDFLPFFTLPYHCLFFWGHPWSISLKQGPACASSHHCPLALLSSAPRWAWSWIAVADNPKVGEDPPALQIFLCACPLLVAISCLVLLHPQDKRAGQSATAFLSTWACLPGGFLCWRCPRGLNVVLECGRSWSLLIKYYSVS